MTDTGSVEDEGATFVIVSANCGGAARAISAADGGVVDRSKTLGAYIKGAGGPALRQAPVVAGLQEMSRFDAPSPDRPSAQELLDLPRENGSFYYVPTLSTDWYPQKSKWQVRWDENVCHAEQGVAVCALHGAVLQDPEANAPPACGDPSPFAGAVIDLPVVKFRRSEPAGEAVSWENWIKHKVAIGDEAPYSVEFRHSRYLGDRDTEPRIATAHRVRLSAKNGPREFVFINLHLTTLREPSSGADSNSAKFERARRSVSREAEFLRHLQLSEVCDFISRVYSDDALRLPVIVAGDFNTAPDRPDLRQFMASAFLKPVFQRTSCWSCGGAPLTAPRTLYSSKAHSTVLTKDAETFEQVTGETPTPLQAAEYCSNCGKALFTHKRNFQLVDNILYTDSAAPGAPDLRSRIAFTDPATNAEIGEDTYFSDHFPISGRFRLV